MEKKILMCGSELSVKGGMVSVIKNYLGYDNWKRHSVLYVPTHTEKNKVVVALYFLVAYIKIVWLALTKKISLAYLHTAEKGSFYRKSMIVRTLKHFGIPAIMHHHAAEFEAFYSSLSEKGKKYVSDTLTLADTNIVLSKTLIPMITEKAPNAKVKVLYNAVKSYPEKPYNKNGNTVLFLGRLGKRKGVYDLLQAIVALDKKVDANVKFALCGDGEIEEVTAKVKELGIEHRICHIGWIDGEQKAAFLKDTMINVLPSYNEGLPMTILETMAYGIPNISTRIASIPEVLEDEENGFLLTPGDVDLLSQRLEQLISDSELREKFSEKSWKLINERFALEKHMETVEEYISECLG